MPFSKIHKKSSLAIFSIYISSLKNRVSWNPGVRPFWENPGNCFFTFLLEYCPKYTVFWHTFSIFEHNYQQLFISLRKTDYQQPILLWKFHLFQLGILNIPKIYYSAISMNCSKLDNAMWNLTHSLTRLKCYVKLIWFFIISLKYFVQKIIENRDYKSKVQKKAVVCKGPMISKG